MMGTMDRREKTQLERLLEEDTFRVFVPGANGAGIEVLEKSVTGDVYKAEDIEKTRPIGGWCSTETRDRQDEVVVAKGLDFSEFLNFGYYNDNHKQSTGSALGWPRLAVLKGSRWYTEGNLLVNYPPADDVWALAKSLKESGSPRRLGFSIEGKVQQRTDEHRIVRAIVRHVAITNSPVNTDCTWEILGKAFASHELVDTSYRKALSAGSAAVAHSGGSALRAESLEGAEDEDFKKMDLEEAARFVKRLRPHLALSTCRCIAQRAMTR